MILQTFVFLACFSWVTMDYNFPPYYYPQCNIYPEDRNLPFITMKEEIVVKILNCIAISGDRVLQYKVQNDCDEKLTNRIRMNLRICQKVYGGKTVEEDYDHAKRDIKSLTDVIECLREYIQVKNRVMTPYEKHGMVKFEDCMRELGKNNNCYDNSDEVEVT